MFLQMSREGKTTGGDVKHRLIFGYDTSAKRYTVTLFGLIDGAAVAGNGTNNGYTATLRAEKAGRGINRTIFFSHRLKRMSFIEFRRQEAYRLRSLR